MTGATDTQRPLVCVYLISTHLGGGERSVLTLIQAMHTRQGINAEPWILLPKEEGPLIDLLKKSEIPFEVLKMPRLILGVSRLRPFMGWASLLVGFPMLIIYLLRLILHMRRKRPALIYSSALKCHIFSAVLGRLLQIPVLWHLRDIISQKWSLKTLRFLAKHNRVTLVANSQATAQAFDPHTKMVVVHNGIDPNSFKREANRDWNREAGWPSHRLVIGMVGALARWKGQIEFLRMAAKLTRMGKDLGFVIVGGEIYDTSGDRGFLAEIKEEALKLGIYDRVYFAGFRSDPARVMNGLDLLVHASTRPEPFGRVLIEAMACGVPVIASAAGGVLEIIKTEKVGLTFLPGQVDEMCRQVARLVDNADLRKKISEDAYLEFNNRFTDQMYVSEISQLFETQFAAYSERNRDRFRASG
ncbi:MAG: glycosyltransferase [Bdellovibrionota bacterium]